MENEKAKKVILVVLLILLTICMIVVVKKVMDIYIPNGNNIDNSFVGDNDDYMEEEEQEDEIQNTGSSFIYYEGGYYIEKEELIVKANKIDARLREVLTLISLNNDKEGEVSFSETNKGILHALIIGKFIEEDRHLLLEGGLDHAIVSESDYEKVFTEITGIKDVKKFFKGYDLRTIKDENKAVYYEEDGKTYYIVPFGMGMEIGLSVISDVSTKAGRIKLVVKTYDVDYEISKYTHIKTTTFEIEENGLRVYSMNVEKVK